MTQPTIEQCIAYLNDYIEMMSSSVPPDNNALVFNKAIRAALTAQAGDGNRLPLEEIPAGYSFCEMRRSFNVKGGFNVRLISLTRDEYGIGKTPAEAMRAAIAAAKDGAS